MWHISDKDIKKCTMANTCVINVHSKRVLILRNYMTQKQMGGIIGKFGH
jgi:hypothetical protein